MRPVLAISSILSVALCAYLLWPETSVSHPPGVLAPAEPVQLPVPPGKKEWTSGEYRIIPLAEFRLKALVLHTERYWMGRESDLSPVDLALGWGEMSNQEVVDAITVSQGGRWYHWKSEHVPIPARQVSLSSANMHMIPANDDIADALKNVCRGHIVELSGYLVEVQGEEGWSWKSSLRRDDTDGGSCELVWVEHLSYHE
jgi:hypothetical protein